MKRLLTALACMAVAACSNDDETIIGHISATTNNPTVYMHVEDTDGRDLLADAPAVNIVAVATGQPLGYSLLDGQPLPWGGTGTLLAFQPAEPYHDADDREYVYTIDPLTAIAIGNCNAILLRRTFDYDYRRQPTGDRRQDVSVSYTPERTTLCGYAMQSDTLRIIMESGYPNLRVERGRLTVEMRLPAVSDSLARLPLSRNDNGEWQNDLLSFRLLYSGRTIAKPRETVTAALCTEQTTTDDGQQRDDAFLALTISLPLPYIYDQNETEGYHMEQFYYDFVVSSPTLFGDDGEHSFHIEASDWFGRGSLRYWRIYQDGRTVDEPTLAAPDHFIADFRQEPTN